MINIFIHDTVLFVDSAEELQTSLNDFVSYCNDWNLTINPDKTKIMIFGERTND